MEMFIFIHTLGMSMDNMCDVIISHIIQLSNLNIYSHVKKTSTSVYILSLICHIFFLQMLEKKRALSSAEYNGPAKRWAPMESVPEYVMCIAKIDILKICQRPDDLA
jgi:hypothetical protein